MDKKSLANLVREINQEQIRKDLIEFEVGDTIKVVTQVSNEKNNKNQFRRIIFKGIVTSSVRENSLTRAFTVFQENNKITIKKKFFYNSPLIVNIELVSKSEKKIRRAKLFYLERKISEKNNKN